MTAASSLKPVGQDSIKNLLEIFSKLSSSGKRLTFVLHGDPGSGKYTLLNSTLKNTMQVTASNINTIEELTQCIRRCVIIKLKEKVSIIKGEVLEIKHNKIVLKTSDMQSEFSLGKKMKQELIMEKISSGDVVQIIKETGKVKKLGKVFVKTHDFDVLGPDVNFIDCVEGNLVNVVESENCISLCEFDALNSNDIYGQRHINFNVRQQVDNKVSDWVEEGLATIEYRSLIIKNCEFLSDEMIYFLCERMLKHMPNICLVSTDKEFLCKQTIKGCLRVKIDDYSIEDIGGIFKQHCISKNYQYEEDILNMLSQYAKDTSIKKSIKLLDVINDKLSKKEAMIKREEFLDMFEILK